MSLLELMCTCRGMLRHNHCLWVPSQRPEGAQGQSQACCPLYCLPPRHYKGRGSLAVPSKELQGSQERSDFTELWCLLSYLGVGERNCKFFFQVSFLEE